MADRIRRISFLALRGRTVLTFRWKTLALNIIDSVLLNLAVIGAMLLRFDGQIPERFWNSWAMTAPFYTLGVLLLLYVSGVNRTLWRYAGLSTFFKIVRTLFFAGFVFFLVNIIPNQQFFPKSVIIVAWVLSTVLIVGCRMAWKMYRTPSRRSKHEQKRILIAGAGDVGATLATELLRRRDSQATPVGFVDDDSAKLGREVEHLPVLGATIDLPRIIEERRIDEVLIAAPSAPAGLVRQIVTYCQEAGVECRTVPALSDYVAGKGALGQVRGVQIEDLLGRDPVTVEFEKISQRMKGCTVLVTGAAGSIGSELCRQLARFEPGHLIAMDHNENQLTYLGLDLAEHHPNLDVLYAVGDVKDEFGIDELVRTHQPTFVFHAAAHKHVNLLERTPREAILNNIMGTRNVARAAGNHGVSTFVLISTDKAVNPTNVMGASKRGCEMVLQSMAMGGGFATKFVAVRFGNVLGSEGSVLPIFRRQMETGGPLTVTHPEARRYFMTIPEASQLVIQAAQLGESGNVFVLDMGEQVRIVDVAEQLIRLSGLRPGIDMPIRFIGLRPGEKLAEELLTDSEQTRMTKHSKIFQWELDVVDPPTIERRVDRLISNAHHASPDELRRGLEELVPEYRQIVVAALPGERIVETVAEVVQPESETTPDRTVRKESGLKRVFDFGISGILLALFAPFVGLVWLFYRLAGSGSVRFIREERVGRNRRQSDRREQLEGSAQIDRRDRDRRQRDLPGPIFVCYRMESDGAPGDRQKAILGWARRYRFDRVLYLWNVLRGQMSLVGPSARLAEEESFSQDWTTAYIHSRRPGLIGPGSLFAGAEEDRLTNLYDGYYSRFGGLGLDVETLIRSVPRILRGENTLQK